jgi:hypothetical protein
MLVPPKIGSGARDIVRGGRMDDIKGNVGFGANRVDLSADRLDSAFESISYNVTRLAETGTRMEAFKLRNKILQDLEALRPILYKNDSKRALIGEPENMLPELRARSYTPEDPLLIKRNNYLL